MGRSFSQAMSTQFSEYDDIKASLGLIEGKAEEMQEKIEELVEINTAIASLFDNAQDQEEQGVEQQVSLTEQIVEQLDRFYTLLTELSKLQTENNSKGDPKDHVNVQEECLEAFNRKIREAHSHYKAKREEYQEQLTELLQNLSSQGTSGWDNRIGSENNIGLSHFEVLCP